MKKIKSDRKSLMLQQYQKFRTDEKKKKTVLQDHCISKIVSTNGNYQTVRHKKQ